MDYAVCDFTTRFLEWKLDFSLIKQTLCDRNNKKDDKDRFLESLVKTEW